MESFFRVGITGAEETTINSENPVISAESGRLPEDQPPVIDSLNSKVRSFLHGVGSEVVENFQHDLKVDQKNPGSSESRPPSAAVPSRYESQKKRDWNSFGQYLRNHRPPIVLEQCNGAHVIEFLKYLDQFGKTKVHATNCHYFGISNPPHPCSCPLRQAWGSLDALIGRLRAAFEEHGGNTATNPFGARLIRVYLREVRESQARARGIVYGKKRKGRNLPQVSMVPGAGSSSTEKNSQIPDDHHRHHVQQIATMNPAGHILAGPFPGVDAASGITHGYTLSASGEPQAYITSLNSSLGLNPLPRPFQLQQAFGNPPPVTVTDNAAAPKDMNLWGWSHVCN